MSDSACAVEWKRKLYAQEESREKEEKKRSERKKKSHMRMKRRGNRHDQARESREKYV